ncbi:AcrR family transcriptional regulator [Nocardia transvalensis]|uniref:AcrR family transcriptional regulator n=1 Tax=Nocardia transvalensis TaxID=37333 RepID=A0A7W9PL49_9NOCA|nr:TetR family transcriptional regulator [Nocardia transvalensis]MBB5918204.1 AcrR family transcriptional regulator [Nocardia transvalensis]
MAGLRERKKAQTRKRLADVSFALFRERGFDNVTVAEIADAADIAVSTLFSYVPSKEALIFDQDDEFERAAVDAVRDRAAGTSIIDALEAHMIALRRAEPDDGPNRADFQELLGTTPALQEYAERIFRRWEDSLAVAIAEEAGLPPADPGILSLTRFVMEANGIADRQPNPEGALREIYDRLRRGWGDIGG